MDSGNVSTVREDLRMLEDAEAWLSGVLTDDEADEVARPLYVYVQREIIRLLSVLAKQGTMQEVKNGD